MGLPESYQEEKSHVKGEGVVTIRILIADDHTVVRKGLHMFLQRDPDLAVVGEAANGAEAIKLSQQLHPDVVLMDLLMPGIDGIAATRAIRNEFPEIEVLALTSVLERASVVEAIRAGAIGYLLKDIQAAELRLAIKAAAAGQVQLSPQASAYLLGAIRTPEPPEPLTPREMDVLRLLAQGYSNKEIARALHLVEETIKDHVRHILAKLGVQSRTQAVLAAIRLGMVSSPSKAGQERSDHA
jgi:DNA-binding NarL/FixJ family response regulator